MARVRVSLAAVAAVAAAAVSVLMTACGSGSTGTPTPPTYTLTINSSNPASGVTISVGNPLNNVVSQGTTPFTETGSSGTQYILTAPATSGGNNFSSWSGCTTSSTNGVTCNVTLNGNMTVSAAYATPALVKPTVTVTPASSSITTAQSLSVSVAVAGPSGGATPTGSVTLASGTYTSAAATLSGGAATITIPAGSLASGSDILTATYTPDSSSTSAYSTSTGTATVSVSAAAATSVSVDQSSVGPAVTSQVLGMNLAAWYDVVGNAAAINAAFSQAGITALRWPGGSWSDAYHWNNTTNVNGNNLPYMCTGTGSNTGWGGYSTFSQFVTGFLKPGGYNLALTANYGSNETCSGGGDPSEAAAWAAAAVTDGYPASRMTVGNEIYGSWEYDLHTVKHDPTTYADSVIGPGGYYALIKAASPTTQVGVDVDANCTTANGCTNGWDSTVLSLAKGSYDFVEYHFYPQNPGGESDQFLLYQAAPQFTSSIDTIKSELTTAGEPNTPIYVGEVGSVSSNPGKQSWSITQGLYAGQILGEAMNDGISRLTWWIGFGNCNGNNGNNSASLYGWQNFGAYNVFADGSGDTGGANNSPCNYGGPIGTLSPTARAFQLFSHVAVTGENALTATVSGGDTTDVRAYAATHSGGTALVLFNLNETASEPVQITLSSQTSTTDMQLITYDKALYDQTNAATPVWAAPTTTDLGAQSLPYTLTLQPWSMNVVIIK